MLWNEKNGPMITALWNVSMTLAGGGQRTYNELEPILIQAGFKNPQRQKAVTAMELGLVN